VISEHCWAMPDLECLVEIRNGRMIALTDTYIPDESMSLSDRLFVAARELVCALDGGRLN
jgi:hypothetical protein